MNKHIELTDRLAIRMANIVDKLEAGKIDMNKAIVINKIAITSINAVKEGVMTAHHHKIQNDKVAMHQKEIDVKKQHIELQYKKFNLTH